MPARITGRKVFGWLALIPALCMVTMVIGGYFDRDAMRWLDPTAQRRHDLVAIYFSGDMGLDVGTGAGAIAGLRAHGVPVLAVNSSLLFRQRRDRGFVDSLVADSIRTALARSGATRVALLGGSFGADILDTGVGMLPPPLRARIASVVLVVPGTQVYYHANPLGLFYTGDPDSDPRHTIRLLRGLPVTCIFGTGEADSLCRMPELAPARRIAIPDGHLMLSHYDELARLTVHAAMAPPAAME